MIAKRLVEIGRTLTLYDVLEESVDVSRVVVERERETDLRGVFSNSLPSPSFSTTTAGRFC